MMSEPKRDGVKEMVNTALLESTLDHIKSYPELHNQGIIFQVNEFGLSACFAGRALLLAGYKAALLMREGAFSGMARHPVTGEIVLAWDEAKGVLGLTDQQARDLFAPVNTRSALELKAKDLLNE